MEKNTMRKIIFILYCFPLIVFGQFSESNFSSIYSRTAITTVNTSSYNNLIPISHTISAGNFYYTPSNLNINVGDTVIWTNNIGFHDVNGDVNSQTGSSFGNPVSFYLPPVQGPATIGSYVFNTPGTYFYDCSIGNHAANGMIGTIVVNELLGCTDSSACNYDPNATTDDNSCVYNVVAQNTSSICDGDSIIVADGYTGIISNVYYLPGNYVDTLSSYTGCDSILYTYITNAFVSTQYSQFICNGDSIVIVDPYTGIISNIYYSPGSYIDTLTTYDGCDSILTTNVILNNVITQNTLSICDGDSIIVADGYTGVISNVYYLPGNYVDTLSSYTSCDSILYTDLFVNDHTESYDTINTNNAILWNGVYLTNSGNYSDTLINAAGCDSVVNLNLTVSLTAINEIDSSEKKLIKITNFLGKKIPLRKNQPLFYIYDDGTVEKKIIIE